MKFASRRLAACLLLAFSPASAADPATKHIPILALTAHAFDDARREAKAVGCDGFVTKPCLPDELVAKIRAVLDTGRKKKR